LTYIFDIYLLIFLTLRLPQDLIGEDCNQQCSLKCTDQHCYPGNGSCVWGCNCLRDNCDNSTICTEGCNKGYAAQYCNQCKYSWEDLSVGVKLWPSFISLWGRHQLVRDDLVGVIDDGQITRVNFLPLPSIHYVTIVTFSDSEPCILKKWRI